MNFPRPVKEIKDLYASVIYQVALRTMWECFAAAEAQDVVETVVFNGIVPATNRATGQPEELHLVSAPASGQPSPSWYSTSWTPPRASNT